MAERDDRTAASHPDVLEQRQRPDGEFEDEGVLDADLRHGDDPPRSADEFEQRQEVGGDDLDEDRPAD
ncbi:hypothetical protein FTX61_05220 [Nitriliruptoraceae bacterium ZYF776]|nr:hypothetical protein [Profundirhabdus halotolerans]